MTHFTEETAMFAFQGQLPRQKSPDSFEICIQCF